MAIIAKRRIEVAKTVHGNSPWTQLFPEAASQTFKLGAVVTLVAGMAQEAGANPTRILGIAAEDGHNDPIAGHSYLTVWIADDETIFVANLAGAQTTAITDVGAGYAILKDTGAPGGDVWEVDKSDSTNRRVIVVDLDRRDNIGDEAGRVLFMFFSMFRVLSYTS
jgi:hypothetical protein